MLVKTLLDRRAVLRLAGSIEENGGGPARVGLGAVVLVVLAGASSCGDSQTHGAPGSVFLGPDAHPLTEVADPIVRHRLGEPEGPGMIFQGDAIAITPAPPNGIVLFTAYNADGPIQLFRDGRLEQEFGRHGSGPGEYQFPGGLVVDPSTGRVWARDGLRMISFEPDGSPGPTLNAAHAGSSVWDRMFLSDGSLLLVGPGGTADNFGYLLHRYDFTTRTWSSHLPVARDTAFVPYGQPRVWQRKLALSQDGKVILTSHDYEILILDPEQGFNVDRRIVRRPPGWPEDPALDHAQGRIEHPLYPAFGLLDTWSDAQGRLWVLTHQPKADWQEDLIPAPDGDPQGGFVRVGPDYGTDSLVEVLDPEAAEVLGSFKIAGGLRSIVGAGQVARYAGDLPFPQIEVLEIPFQEE